MPAVTCSAQASILTGKLPQEHGIVGNGWLFRETGEVRFWQQSNALIQAEPVDATARRPGERAWLAVPRGQALLVVQPGSAAEILGDAETSLRRRRQQGLRHRRHARRALRIARAVAGSVPVPHVLGTEGGLALHATGSPAARPRSSRSERPELTLVYLPHLDYDPQRFGPSGCDMARLAGELDDACALVLDAAAACRGPGLDRQRIRSCRRDPPDPARIACCARRDCSRFGPGRSARCSTRSAAGPSRSAITRLRTSTSIDADDSWQADAPELIGALPGWRGS